jgi:type II secretion system protein N
MAERSVTLPAAASIRGRSSIIVACAVLGFAVFVSFMIADFPYNETLSSILAPYQLKLTYRSQHLSPPFAAKLTDVRLFSAAALNADPLMQSPAVTLAPTLSALLFGRRAIRVRASLYGGTVHLAVSQHADTVDLNFTLDSLKLAQSPPLQHLGVVLEGDLSGAGAAHLDGPALPDDHATLALSGDNLAFSVVRGFPPVHLGTLTGKLQLDNGVVRLTDIVAHGADLDLQGHGAIELGATPEDATIDATFNLVPTQSGRDHFGFFLKFLPHPPGPDAPYTLQGYLQSPSIN